MEARIVEIEAERVLEVDPAPHRLSGTAVRQAEQKLQDAHRGQLRRRRRGDQWRATRAGSRPGCVHNGAGGGAVIAA